MARVLGTDLLFKKEDVENSSNVLIKSVRQLCLDAGITNDEYLSRHYDYFHRLFPKRSRKEFALKAASDRRHMFSFPNMTSDVAKGLIIQLGFTVTKFEVSDGQVDLQAVDNYHGVGYTVCVPSPSAEKHIELSHDD